MRLTAVLHALLLPVLFLAGRCIADDNVDRLVERLRSNGFEDREEATRALIAAGERGVAAAKVAALDGELEVRVRGMRVLLSLALSPDEAGSQGAEEVLIELAQSNNARVARLAEDSLRDIQEVRREQEEMHLAALRKLGGVALRRESGEVYRIEFEGEYITDEGLEFQRSFRARHKFFDETEFAARYVVRTRVMDKDLTLLKKFPNLTYLDLQRTETSAAGLAHLKSLRKLEYLVLSPQMTDEGLPHLASFKELRSLCLAQTQVTGVGFARLRGLTHLEEIDLTNSLANDAGLKEISRHQSLLTLNLGNTKVTDEGTPHLSHLHRLQRLTLHRTGVTDAGLRHILVLEDLRSLTLDGTKVTDAGIGQLAGLKSLQAVSFTEPLVSKKQAWKSCAGKCPKPTSTFGRKIRAADRSHLRRLTVCFKANRQSLFRQEKSHDIQTSFEPDDTMVAIHRPFQRRKRGSVFAQRRSTSSHCAPLKEEVGMLRRSNPSA